MMRLQLTPRIAAAVRLVACAIVFLGTSHASAVIAAEREGVDAAPGEAFATVGKTVISAQEYEAALAMAVRRKYYHGRVPEGELDALRVEVADSLINRTLLLAEVKRRGIQPDRAAVKRTVAGYEQRYKQSAQWQRSGKEMLAAVTRQLEQQSQLERLEAAVRTTPEPTEAQALRYYETHRDLFVEPEQVRLAVILLRVDPASPRIAWEKAVEEATAIVTRLRKGASFEELARLHSSDSSAERGGDLGYLHRGMLPEGTQQVVDNLQPGRISDPIRVLEGVAVVRVLDRKPAQQRTFDEVRDRAGDLWRREQADTQWHRLIDALRATVTIRINTARYPALAQAGTHEGRETTP
jgi:parvulin-like peptidyl-prolyl isomerase